MNLQNLLNTVVRSFGLRVVKSENAELVYIHKYTGGYEQYREVQIRHNKRKLNSVWADEHTLATIAADLREHGLGKTGICHGARNGFEVKWFRDNLHAEVIGTDISETATEFPNMVVWDFHKENPEWEGKHDFVYTNSLDQAMDPSRALRSWTKQLTPNGRIYIEHTMVHSAMRASEMDPFGAHPMAMPYLLFNWGKGNFRLSDILTGKKKATAGGKVRDFWIFVLERDRG
jgi:hypothetical protein